VLAELFINVGEVDEGKYLVGCNERVVLPVGDAVGGKSLFITLHCSSNSRINASSPPGQVLVYDIYNKSTATSILLCTHLTGCRIKAVRK